jgi:hypothetical protein
MVVVITGGGTGTHLSLKFPSVPSNNFQRHRPNDDESLR